MNLGTLIYLLFTVTVVVFVCIWVGRYLYSRKHQVTIDALNLKELSSREAAKLAISLASYGTIREDLLKNSASFFDEDAYLRSFISFLTPDNVQAIINTNAEIDDVQY